MSHSLVLLSAGVVTFSWLFFMLADYRWEKKKRRGLDLKVRPARFGTQSERAEYEWYSWIRYLAVILVTYLNTAGLMTSEPGNTEGIVSPIRIVWAFSFVIFLSIVLLAIDGYWDRMRRRGLNRIHASLFWSYFWLRYPVLIWTTITATKRGLQP